jgi:hypothetical protein
MKMASSRTIALAALSFLLLFWAGANSDEADVRRVMVRLAAAIKQEVTILFDDFMQFSSMLPITYI